MDRADPPLRGDAVQGRRSPPQDERPVDPVPPGDGTPPGGDSDRFDPESGVGVGEAPGDPPLPHLAVEGVPLLRLPFAGGDLRPLVPGEPIPEPERQVAGPDRSERPPLPVPSLETEGRAGGPRRRRTAAPPDRLDLRAEFLLHLDQETAERRSFPLGEPDPEAEHLPGEVAAGEGPRPEGDRPAGGQRSDPLGGVNQPVIEGNILLFEGEGGAGEEEEEKERRRNPGEPARATERTRTERAPMSASTRARAYAVDPVVITSSTTSTRAPRTASGFQGRKAHRTFRRRPSGSSFVWERERPLRRTAPSSTWPAPSWGTPVA